MIRMGIVLMVLLAQVVHSEEKTVTGTVTYVATGTVYTSLGRESGVKDSSLVYVKSGADTLATLQVMAVSSKSSACRIVRSKSGINVGASVVARVTIEARKQDAVPQAQASSFQAPSMPTRVAPTPSPIDIRGRVSAQYYVNRYDNEAYNTTQPGVVINLSARSTDIPLKFELYSNLRTLSFGNVGPFSKSAVNQSRIYRLSLEYDDGVNDFSVGRIIPAQAPSVGYVDGAMYARKLGNVTLGTTMGYQPSYTLRGLSTDFKKLALFATIQPVDSMNLILSAAYARTFYLSTLDREVVSGNLSFYTLGGFQVYGYSEVDLRVPSKGEFRLSPTLTSLFVNVGYRVTQMLTLGVGGDASRPLYTFSAARFIPDSLRETSLRSGLNATISLYFPGGITLSNTYAPRTSQSRFATVYANYTTIGFADLFSSGISFRSNFNLNTNEYSTSNGYGVGLQRGILDIADINIRFQQNTYTLKNYEDRHISRTVGADLIINLTRGLAVMTSYDRLDGYGITSNSIFAELSVRF